MIYRLLFSKVGEQVFIEPMPGWDEVYSDDYESLVKLAEKEIDWHKKQTEWGYGTYIYSISEKDKSDKYTNLLWNKELIVPKEIKKKIVPKEIKKKRNWFQWLKRRTHELE